MLEFLNPTNISVEDVGFGCVVGEKATVNLYDDNVSNVEPRNYRWTDTMLHFSYYRLYLVTDGRVELNVNGKPFIMEKGKMYLIRPFSIKSATPPESFSHYYMHFNIKGMPFNMLDYYNIEDNVEYTIQEIDLFKRLLRHFHDKGLNKQLITHGVFSLLLSKFFKENTQINPYISRFEPVLKYIDDNICKNITLEELAEIMHMNMVYFATIFQKTFKTSPIKYVIEKKMLFAQQLLASQKMTIREISDNLGYTNEYYFSAAFKHTMGISPTKWRQMYFSDKKPITPN